MFTKVASDLVGLSDICAVIKPIDFAAAPTASFILSEEQERIVFLLRSKADEYCFTNLAFVHLNGSSAVSKKRLVLRYPYKTHHFTDVQIETAGTVDLDIELKFKIGETRYSIDVAKKEMENLTCMYKVLLMISERQATNKKLHELQLQALTFSMSTLPRINISNPVQANITLPAISTSSASPHSTSSSSSNEISDVVKPSNITPTFTNTPSYPTALVMETAEASFNYLVNAYYRHTLLSFEDIFQKYLTKL